MKEADGTSSVVSTQKLADCMIFQYNGATLARKSDNRTCLTWAPESNDWSLQACSLQNEAARFSSRGSGLRSSSAEVYCNMAASDSCVEPAEHMCTTEKSQCSVGQCRCEDLSMEKRVLRTLNGSVCYACMPPVVHCPVSVDNCTFEPCECAEPGHIKVRNMPLNRGNASEGASCMSCQPGQVIDEGWAGSTPALLGCIAVGVVAGCSIQYVWAAVSGAVLGEETKTSRRRGRGADGARTWSERWAEQLEDSLGNMCSWCSDWLVPILRCLGNIMLYVVDVLDELLDLLYCFVDIVKEKCLDIGALIFPHLAVKEEKAATESEPPQSDMPKKKSAATSHAAEVESVEQDWTSHPLVRAAMLIAEHSCKEQKLLAESEAAEEPIIKEKAEPLPWDPLNHNFSSANVALSGEWMKHLVKARQAQGPPAAPAATRASDAPNLTAGQSRAIRRLQQRREAKKGKQEVAAGTVAEVKATGPSAEQEKATDPIDDSWIDQMEKEEAKAREAREAKANARREKKERLKANKVRQVSEPNQPEPEAQPEEETTSREEPATEESPDKAGLCEADESGTAGHGNQRPGGGAGQSRGTSSPGHGAEHGAEGGATGEGTRTHRRQDSAGDDDEDGDEEGDDNEDDVEDDDGQEEDEEEEEEEEDQDEENAGLEEQSVEQPEEEHSSTAPTDELQAPSARDGEALTSHCWSTQAELVAEQHLQQSEEADMQVVVKKDKRRLRNEAPAPKPAATASQASTPAAKPQQPAPQSKVAAASENKPPQAQPDPLLKPPTDGSAPARKSWAWGAPPGKKEEAPKTEASDAPTPAEAAAAKSNATVAKPTKEPEKPRASAESEAEQKEAAPAAEKPSTSRPPPERESAKFKVDFHDNGPEIVPQEGWEALATPDITTGDSTDNLLQHLTGVDAPEFIPMSMMQQGPACPPASTPDRARMPGPKETMDISGLDPSQMMGSTPLTTVLISGIPSHSANSFKQQLDSWGLMGTYNFINMQTDTEAVVNFIDPMFATLCMNILQQCQFEGASGLHRIQGLENNIAHANTLQVGVEQPLVFHTPVPSEWAVNGVNSMLDTKFSPQIRDQFHKTKLCTFHKKKRCALGSSCPFAHFKEELQQAPDLHKTKLCYNFFRRKCNDKNCKFAHGYQELRATSGVYKTELCRWWAFGACKAGNACRYAHGLEELRGWQAGSQDNGGRTSFQAVSGYQEMQKQKEREAEPVPQVVEAPAPQHTGLWNPHLTPQKEWGTVAAPPPAAPQPQQSQPTLGQAWPTSTMAKDSSELFTRQSSGAFSEVDSASEMSSINGGNAQGLLYRQQTAPPAYNTIPEIPSLADDRQASDNGFVLRVKGTFMEAVELKSEPPVTMRRRSWSDGDLPQLMEVMAGMEEEEVDFD